MADKPTYEELERRVREVERESLEYRRDEEALRRSEQRFRSLAEKINECLWEVDQSGVVTYISPRVKDLLGYEVGEILGGREDQ